MVATAKTSRGEPVAFERLTTLAAKLARVNISSFRKAVAAFISQQRAAAAAAAAGPPPTAAATPKSSPKSQAGPDPKLVNQYGEPIAFSTSKISHLNQPYWAASYVKTKTKIIHEPAERDFYDYDDAIGIFGVLSPDRIRTELGALILQAAKTWPGLDSLQNYRNEKTLTGIVSYLRGLVEERDFFNITSPVVHLGNCTLVFKPDHSSFSVESFSPKHRSRNRSPINYDPKADCPEFKRLLLSHVRDDDRELLQKYAGQCLLGRNITQRFVILDGPGSASKGSFVLTISGIIGRENSYELRTKLLEERFEIGRMLGRTLLVGSDVKGSFLYLPGAYRIKSLVGGDKLEAELKRSNHRFDIYGVFNIMITSNARLHIRLEGDRSAWERRLTIVRYEKPYSGDRIYDVDKYLLSIEAPGILNWCIEGLRKLFEDYDNSGDIILSDDQKARVNTLLSESDSLRIFLRENISYFDAHSSGPCCLTTEEIIDDYIKYCVQDKNWRSLPRAEVERQLPDLMAKFFGVTKSHDLQRNGKARRGYWNVRFSP